MTAVKVSALELIPLPGLAGFYVIKTILTKLFGSGLWLERFAMILLWPWLLMIGL